MSSLLGLLRADLYRTLRSRWPWVVLAAVALCTVGSAVLTVWWPLDPSAAYDGLTGRAGAFCLGGRGSSIALVPTIAPFVAAHLSCADSGCGFDRTLLASRRGRLAYLGEKHLFTVLVTGVILLSYLLLGSAGVLVTMRPVANAEPLWQVVAWAGEGWLASCAYALPVLLVGQLTRSRAASFVTAFLLASSTMEQLIFSALLLASNMFGLGWDLAIEGALAWAPYVTTAAVGSGAGGMLAVDATGVAPALRALAVCLPLGVACCGLGMLLGTRRDLA